MHRRLRVTGSPGRRPSLRWNTSCVACFGASDPWQDARPPKKRGDADFETRIRLRLKRRATDAEILVIATRDSAVAQAWRNRVTARDVVRNGVKPPINDLVNAS